LDLNKIWLYDLDWIEKKDFLIGIGFEKHKSDHF